MKVHKDETFNFQRLDLVYSPKYGIYIVSLLCAAFFSYYYYRPEAIVKTAVWLTVFCGYVLLRFLSSLHYWQTKSNGRFNYKFYETEYFIISCFGGIIWGASAYLFLPNFPPEKLIIAMTIYAGVCAGAIGSNSSSIYSNLGFNYSLLGSAMISISFYPSSYKYDLLSIFAIFIVGITMSAFSVYKNILRNLLLRMEKENLLAEIDEANTKRIVIERQALQSSKMATIGEMASGMAHEINNPLTIIKGNLTLIKRRTFSLNNEQEDDVVKTSIDRCLNNIERIVKAIESLKKMSQLSLNNPIQEASIESIIQDSLGFIHEKLKCSNIKLTVDIKNPNQVIVCDTIATSQTLLGIISHAFHSCQDKSFAWIYLYAYNDAQSAFFELSTSEVDKDFKIIKDALENNSFDFQNKSKAYNLALCQSMAKKLGGQITISEKNNQSLILQVPLAGEVSKPIAA